MEHHGRGGRGLSRGLRSGRRRTLSDPRCPAGGLLGVFLVLGYGGGLGSGGQHVRTVEQNKSD